MSQYHYYGNAGGSNFDSRDGGGRHGPPNHDVGRGGRPHENHGGRGGGGGRPHENHGGRGGGGGRPHENYGGRGGGGGRPHENYGGRGGGGGGGRPHENYGGRGGGRPHEKHGGRGRGGGKYWSGKRRMVEEQGITVQTNCYQLVPSNDYGHNETINQYAVTIDALVRKRDDEISDSTYTPKNEDQRPRRGPYYLVKKTFHTEVISASDDRSTKLSRRILNHCNKKLQEIAHPLFIYDGTNVAYSRFRLTPVENNTRKLYTEYHETYELRNNEQDNEYYQESAAKKQKKDEIIEYIICINMNADDDDADTTVKKGWYLVSFRHVSDVPMSLTDESNAILPLVNCINTALKGNMISHCVGFGRSPYMYFFQPPKEQEAILPVFLKEKLYNSIIPLLGLKQSVRYCSNSTYGLLLVADFGLRYMYNDVNARTNEPFHVLQVDPSGRSATIANTVNINNVHEHIPRDLWEDLSKRLQKINFHVRYYRGGIYENKLRAQQQRQQLQEADQENLTKGEPEESTGGNQRRKPLTDEQIERKKFFLKKNVRLHMANDGPSIIWEPEKYTFRYIPKANTRSQSLSKNNFDSGILADSSNPEAPTNERQITVACYFWEQYAYKLKYPKMPLIRVKSRHKDMKEYYPLEMLLQCQDEVKNMNTKHQIDDGLRLCDEYCLGKRINKISEMLHGGGLPNDPLQSFHNGQSEVLQQQFQLELKAKPIEVKAKVLTEPKLVSEINDVGISDGSLTLSGKFAVPSTIASFAVLNYCGKSECDPLKSWFRNLFDYCKGRGMNISDDFDFDLLCTNETIPKTLEQMYDHFQVAIEKAQKHFLTPRRNDVNVQTNTGAVVKCGVQLCEDDAQCVNVWPDDGIIRERISVNRVDCPGIIFIILPDNASSQTYSHVKLLSHDDFVVQSQVVLWNKAKSQGQKGQQYFSNMSYKLNLKLGTALGGEAAWKRKASEWADEVPTLIIGISMASASGQDSLMTVVGNVLLDNIGLNHKQEMCVQKKGPLVDEKAMIAIIKSLAISWSQSNRCQIPERVVIYRSTGDDGMFEDIIGKELKAVKAAFHELNKRLPYYSCTNCQGSSCILCLPKLTMVVAQSQHNILLAPSAPRDSDYNVPSGTCLEGLFPALRLTNDEKMDGLLHEYNNLGKNFPPIDDGTSFALVPQGGLKGTSKCVIYRVIWNENILFMSSSKATQLTLHKIQKLTYHLSFQYGTAPKAPRLPIVLQYSIRLNTIAIGYVHVYSKHLNDPEAVVTNTLGRVRNKKSETFEMPLHTSSMG